MPEAAPPVAQSESVTWRRVPDLGLHLRPVGAMVAVYNEESGDTHLVSGWAAAILERLRVAPARPAELRRHAPPAATGDAGSVTRLLRDLWYLGLIEPVDP